MANRNDTSKPGPARNPNEHAASTAAPPASSSTGKPNPPPPSASSRVSARSRSELEQVIEAERAQLLKAHGVLRCLYEVLLHADGEDAVSYAEAAHVAAQLIDEAAARLDPIRLKPAIEALGRQGEKQSDDEPPPFSGPLRVEEGPDSSRAWAVGDVIYR